MQIIKSNFAEIYHELIYLLPQYNVNIQCRGMNICYELIDIELRSNNNQKIWIYSNYNSRCAPIRFILAEFLWIISASNELASIARFNSRMTQYSDDKIVLNGAYGFRLMGQLEAIIERLLEDKHSRQAYCVIYDKNDAIIKSKDVPCNTALQFLIRDDKLRIRVISRSSDFVTGLVIDMIHWQLLLHCIFYTLKKKYTMLQLGEIVYHIGSLHVYDIDKYLMNNWKSENYAYDFHLRDDYFSLKEKVKRFLDVESLVDICNLYNFSIYETDKLVELNRDFIRQKNKPVR